MKFDDIKAGSSLKDRRLRGELKEFVPITARAKRFPLRKGKNTVIAKRKQFPLILLTLGHELLYISLREILVSAYMQGELNPSTGRKTATRKNYQHPLS